MAVPEAAVQLAVERPGRVEKKADVVRFLKPDLILTGALVYEGVTGNLIDPWVVLGLTEEGTAHGFTGVAPGPTRIDWILCSAHFTPTGGWINRYAEDGRYPSDHFPVVVEFAWPGK